MAESPVCRELTRPHSRRVARGIKPSANGLAVFLGGRRGAAGVPPAQEGAREEGDGKEEESGAFLAREACHGFSRQDAAILTILSGTTTTRRIVLSSR